ncbi:hypothetical protein PR202_ga27396 [Eleusine coracana subsp. coracana]|uniref:Uncharacterized protein n=1 Tax=Eleusine coracana subsp. coracana TaxID=191504 RepID=A0AAV5DFT4_ELECO|nr:hypothetical protein PR202_ga27396 [Eleusine coracana subsp. coracana]
MVADGHKVLDQKKKSTGKKDKPATEPIVVPIVLKMSDFDHKVVLSLALLEEWIATRAFRDNSLPQDHRKLINNLKLIQDYLCSFESQGLTIFDISANSFPQTLDWLHSYLLQSPCKTPKWGQEGRLSERQREGKHQSFFYCNRCSYGLGVVPLQ